MSRITDHGSTDESSAATSALAGDLVRFARLSYERMLAAGTGGNLSCRLPDKSRALVTPSGVSLRDVVEDQLIVVNMQGVTQSGLTGLRPSKESSWHLAIFARCPDVNAVVHLHSPYSVAATSIDPCWPATTVTSRKYLGAAPVVPSAEPGSAALAQGVAEAAAGSSGGGPILILLCDHGIVTLGATVAEAFDTADLAEEAARTYCAARQVPAF